MIPEINVVMNDPRLDHHIPEHKIDVLLSITIIVEFLLTSVHSEFNPTGLVHTPGAIQSEIFTIFIGHFWTQEHKTIP